MTRETITSNARSLLVEQRLIVIRVVGDIADAVIQGDTGEYHAGRDPERGWHCTCQAHGRCSHVAALKMVTVRRPGGGEAVRPPAQPARASALSSPSRRPGSTEA